MSPSIELQDEKQISGASEDLQFKEMKSYSQKASIIILI